MRRGGARRVAAARVTWAAAAALAVWAVWTVWAATPRAYGAPSPPGTGAHQAVPATVGESWGDAWVNVTFTPAKPRAHETMTIDIDVIAGSPSHPVDAGIVTPTLEREAAFSHIIRQPAPATLAPDPRRPGHYSLSFAPPHSGLYRLSLEAPAVHAAKPARIEFPVWPRGVNPYLLVPLTMMAALIAGCIAWTRQQRRRAGSSAPPPRASSG